MLHLVVAASFKYVVEAYEIAFYIGVRVGDAVSDPCLGRQVHHYGELVAVKKGFDYALVGY